MGEYSVSDGTAWDDFDADDDDAAMERAREWLRTGDWDVSRTLWLSASVMRRDGDIVGEVEVTLHPDPPACRGDEHAWSSPHAVVGGLRENPGVWGSGGGVKIKEVCRKCGCYKLTDTWATNPSNGTQGHTSVGYEPADQCSLDWVDSQDGGDE
jgi:hypothetical protein